MGGCISVQNRKLKLNEKHQSLKSRKGRGKTVSPVPGASVSTINKKQTNGSSYSSSETIINNLVHQGSDMSIIANGKPEEASANFHVTEVRRSHARSISHEGSKDDAFFDSVVCLDSDCEDFVSVNGDFLPSAGNTMSLPCSSQETPRPSVASLMDRMNPFNNVTSVENGELGTPCTSDASLKDEMISVEKKKKLREFFMEKLSSEDVTAALYHTSLEPQVNGIVGAKTVKFEVSKGLGGHPDNLKDGVVNNREEELQDLHEKQMGKCCLPRLVPNLRTNEKKSVSPNCMLKENKQY